ncbi:MAG: T9SS type A sorting domain-containing protein, partial [Bacteroidales bacterium]|nr:T9SS type A sorting domain-containing protein [Bacteroidales bacterium]
IFTLADLDSIRTNQINFDCYQNIHFELQNDINDSVTESIGGFCGYFHGKGHTIHLNLIDTDISNNNFISNLSGYMDSITLKGKFLADYCLYVDITETGVLSNIILDLEVIATRNVGLNPLRIGHNVQLLNMNNLGTIKNCINNSDINVSADLDTTSISTINLFSNTNHGKILNCINNGNINITTNFLNSIFAYIFSEQNYFSPEIPDGGYIGNCINNGGININGVPAYCEISVFSYVTVAGSIVNCINNGNIIAKKTDVCGVFAVDNASLISNCLNTGSLIGEEITGGIVGKQYVSNAHYIGLGVINCMNTGNISGNSEVGGIIGKFYYPSGITEVKNNLNLAKTSAYAIIGDTSNTFSQISGISNNYYDKQMVTQEATAIGDIPGVAEGKLTTQLIGTSPELQSMLGDGWSYAEGRYPIPLGLENDSMALVAATPVYLHFETEDDYNHVDSVTRDFTVGLENSVVWNETYGRVSFDDEYASLLSLGYENLVVSLGDYQKEVYINILDTETSIIEESITENGIIYPNPANDYINIKLNGISTDKLEICDITGKVLLSQTIINDYQQIQIRDLKRGMYFLKIYDKNQNIKTLKFVKN